jgi:hypothetical protein
MKITVFYKNVDGARMELTPPEIEEYNNRCRDGKKESFKLAKEMKLRELKYDLEKYIYSVYPKHKQRNMGIYGTEEEREAFKQFKEECAALYDENVEKISNCKSLSSLNGVVPCLYCKS